jgi:hypothetical protein
VKSFVRALLVAGLLAGPGVAARAEPSAGGGFCDLEPGLCAGVHTVDVEPGASASPRRREPPRFYWRRFELNDSRFCTGPDGRQEYMRLIDRVTNQVIDDRFRCPDPTTGRLRPLPPVPPVPAAVWDKVPLPAPEVRVNPGLGGLTGLETFFWYDQSATASLQLDLDGFNTTIDARVVRMRWRTGDGIELTSTVPGSPTQPAAHHIYDAKGTYTVRLDVIWSGTYRFAGPGLDPITVPLGERTFSGQATYAVAEIRGVRQ